MTETTHNKNGGFPYRKRGPRKFFDEKREIERAQQIGTSPGEYQEAKQKGLSYPEAGLPDEEAIFEAFGLSRESL